jgi:DNA repair exonuclease SbcCD nuclease subunit
MHIFLADLQLDKKLYGLRETWEDWFDAFESAIDYTLTQPNVESVSILGDIFDTESIGGAAACCFYKNLKRLEPLNIPIFVILGNHDRTNYVGLPDWLTLAKLVNKNVIIPSLTTPYKLGNINVFGSSFLKPRELKEALAKIPSIEGENWLLLHQALADLCPLGEGDLTVNDVPPHINKVFLGDLHDHQKLEVDNRLFVYPGSIETVSFNQVTEPGFITYKDGVINHISTKQRAYVSIDLSTVPEKDWLNLVISEVNKAKTFFKKAPVLRIYYPFNTWDKYAPIQSMIQTQVLKLFDQELGLNHNPAEVLVQVTPGKDEVRELAVELLKLAQEPHKVDARKLLIRSEVLSEIQAERYPNAVKKPTA